MENKKVSDFKTRLKHLLQERKMTQKDLANLTKITPSSISDWINGKYEAKQDKIDAVAIALHVSPAYLMGYDVPMVSKNISNNENNSIKSELTQEEQKILEPYNKLSTAGKEKAVSYTQDLVDSGKYNKLTKKGQDTYITDIDDMRSYLMNIPIAAFDGKLNPAQMDDEEIQSLYKLLKDNE